MLFCDMVNLGEIGGLFGGCIVFVIMYLLNGVEFQGKCDMVGINGFP